MKSLLYSKNYTRAYKKTMNLKTHRPAAPKLVHKRTGKSRLLNGSSLRLTSLPEVGAEDEGRCCHLFH